MSYLTQKTVKKNIKFNGVALHSGLNVNICIKPAEPNFGIVFKRIDLKTNNLVYPNFNNVTNTSLNTTIENEFGVKVSTIEHLMGALFGLGIDNALIEIDNQEVPILDGSAKVFIEQIITAGVVKVYDLILALTSGGPGYATTTPAMYVMENFFQRANLGQAFAASIIMFISVVCILAPWAFYEFYLRNKYATN